MRHNNALWTYRFFLSYSGFGAQPMGHHNASAATKLRSMMKRIWNVATSPYWLH
jgi:hypothetical protein